jgi:RimJ/RimL family protein N-acetyltransferase
VITTDKDRVGPWVCERTGGLYEPSTSSAIGIERDGKLVGGVLFDMFNGRSICMHVASDGTGHWLTREFLTTCFSYPFLQLGVEVIIGLVDSTNEAALRFDKALGFKVEHTIENAGKTGNLVLLSLAKANCRWIDGGPHGRKKLSASST